MRNPRVRLRNLPLHHGPYKRTRVVDRVLNEKYFYALFNECRERLLFRPFLVNGMNLTSVGRPNGGWLRHKTIVVPVHLFVLPASSGLFPDGERALTVSINFRLSIRILLSLISLDAIHVLIWSRNLWARDGNEGNLFHRRNFLRGFFYAFI